MTLLAAMLEHPVSNGIHEPKHILDLLKKAATANKGLIYLDNGISEAPITVSYAQLLQDATDNAAKLIQAGIVTPGSIAITYFDTHQENVLWFWSVIIAGGTCAVLNPISNDLTTAAGQLDNVKHLFGETPVITSHRLSGLIASRSLNVKSTQQISKLKAFESSTAALHSACSAGGSEITAILFTSGSTGHSKAVKFSHEQLIASVKAKADHLGSWGKTFMSWISFDHSANFCELHLQSLYVGTDQVHVPTAELIMEPHRFFQVLSTWKVGYTFSPNFFLAAAAKSWQEHGSKDANFDLSNLKTIMCGGEANRTVTLQACDAVLRKFGAPAHAIKAAYGLSETCSACFYNLQSPEYDMEHSNVFASVGKHLPDAMEMKIVSRGGDEENPGEGLVYLRGSLIFKGYYNNEEATSACMTEDGWMNTGDIGTLDQNGNLRLLGRAKEVLILNGNNYSSFEIEYAIETARIPGLEISFTAVFSSWDEDKHSEGVVVLFNPTEAAIGPKNLKATLQSIEKVVFSVCAQKPKHIIPLPKALLPKSTIGKLSRAKLRQQYEKNAYDDFIIGNTLVAPEVKRSMSDLTSLGQEIAQVYASIVETPVEDLLGDDALLSSGINSLGFMRLKKALETKLKIQKEIPMALLLRCHSVADLEHELTLIGTLPQNYDPIVPLATQGSKQPLFLLHPGAGEFLCWVGLVKYLPDRPLYALRAKGLHAGEGTFDGIDDLLSTYYKAMRAVQPKGPYAMLGYCFGGLLAFELSKMFEADGEKVVFIGGIDNPPELRRTIGKVQYRSLMIDVLPVVTELTEDEALAFGEETASLTDEEFYAVLFTRFSPEFIEQMDLSVPRLQAFGRVEDCMRQIAAKYDPAGEVTTMDIFCADPMPHFGATPEVWRKDVLGQWKNFVKGSNVRFHDVQGSHISLIKEPHIQDFQRIVNEALEGRGI
ncbi:hypothetical protein AMS68_006836 [Peltaster fructicola]|uniref:Carrier domain-containing protein n=1 Tax=Peltaster fructicola TaxID=286661 RepID=A0A6H0Y383_9PEZI|nr:hypothetical protein AMS68_006836 [Peltaster fructicola]